MEHTGLATFFEMIFARVVKTLFFGYLFLLLYKISHYQIDYQPDLLYFALFLRVELYASSIGCVEESRVEIQ